MGSCEVSTFEDTFYHIYLFTSPMGCWEVSTFEDTFYEPQSPYKVSRDGFMTRQSCLLSHLLLFPAPLADTNSIS